MRCNTVYEKYFTLYCTNYYKIFSLGGGVGVGEQGEEPEGRAHAAGGTEERWNYFTKVRMINYYKNCANSCKNYLLY